MKKNFLTMLLSLFCLSMAGQNNQATQTLLGDANGDGVVNVADIVEINNYILDKPSSRFNSINADTNLDGYVTDDDNLYIQDIILLHHYKNISLSGSVSLASNQANNLFDDYTVTSVIGDSKIKDGDFTLETYEFDVLQTVFVTDESDRVYMMARQPMDEGGNVEINVESTALGFVIIHPVLSALSRSDYNKICAMIKSSNYYQPFYSAVEKVIKRQQDLFDVNNTEMIEAYENLFDDLCNQIDFTQYDENSSSLTRALTRSIENYDQFYPLSVRIYDNSISMWNTALFPSYYGTVTRPNGSVTNFNVLSADDWGWVEFLTHGMATYGEESRFWFNEEGEYRFRLSRVNQEATYDYYLRMTLLALSCLSLPVDNVPHQTLNTIVNSLISIGGSLSDGSMSAAEITQTILSTVCNIIQNDALNAKWKENKSYCQLTNLRKYANLLSRGMIIYNIAKGSSNILLRMIHALRVPEEVNFDLCYYNGNITQCKEAKLYKKSGDNQSGEENTVLELPLEVYVQIIGSDGMYYAPDVNYVVRFEVVSGEGSLTKKEVGIGKDGIVSTRWILGYEGEQKVKAVVVDLLYELEIGEPVYFNATAVKRAASVNTDKYEKISETSYRLYGSYSGYDTRKTGFVYNTTGEPSIQNGTSIVGELLWDTFNAVVDNLNPGMTYYYRAFVNLDGVYIYGETKEFTTEEQKEIKPTPQFEIQEDFADRISFVIPKDPEYSYILWCTTDKDQPLEDSQLYWSKTEFWTKADHSYQEDSVVFEFRHLIPSTTYYFLPIRYPVVNGYISDKAERMEIFEYTTCQSYYLHSPIISGYEYNYEGGGVYSWKVCFECRVESWVTEGNEREASKKIAKCGVYYNKSGDPKEGNGKFIEAAYGSVMTIPDARKENPYANGYYFVTQKTDTLNDQDTYYFRAYYKRTDGSEYYSPVKSLTYDKFREYVDSQ